MHKSGLMMIGFCSLCLALTFLTSSSSIAAEEKNDRLTARIHSDGRVMATPDIATLVFKIETEAPRAQAAAESNARLAEKFLPIIKKALTAEESVQSTGYGVTPIYTYPKRGEPSKITAYRARHSFRVKLKDVKRIGEVIDLGLQNGATSVQGPYWEHSRREELNRQAAVQALAQARRLAEALAQVEQLKVKRLFKVSTEISARPMPVARENLAFAPKAAAETAIEVGEEEIHARIEAIYELE